MPSVLLVDDDAVLLEALTMILTKAGHQVHPVTSGKAAFATLNLLENGNLPQLIITDLHMPGMTGFQLLEMVRTCAQYNHISFLITSASLPPELEYQLAKVERATFVRKPFDIALFCQTVNALSQSS